MKYNGVVQKSKTVDATVIVGVLGVLETNFGMLKGLLGEWYGLSYVVLAVVFYILRKITTNPLGEK
ncbi:MAG: hypothetical protein KAS93_06595 [Gammaproteobacteria bacterium]|nr:hypothetical protein [Gammaproteobacteria bacterium]